MQKPAASLAFNKNILFQQGILPDYVQISHSEPKNLFGEFFRGEMILINNQSHEALVKKYAAGESLEAVQASEQSKRKFVLKVLRKEVTQRGEPAEEKPAQELSTIGPDETLLKWLVYNAHLNGLLADLVNNWWKAFPDHLLTFMPYRSEVTEDQPYMPKIEIAVASNDPDACFVMANIKYKAAYFMESGDMVAFESNEPVVSYQFLIKIQKQGDKAMATLVEEEIECQHKALAPHFQNAIAKPINDYNHLVSVLTDVEQRLEKYKSAGKQFGPYGFFMAPKNQLFDSLCLHTENLRKRLDSVKNIQDRNEMLKELAGFTQLEQKFLSMLYHAKQELLLIKPRTHFESGLIEDIDAVLVTRKGFKPSPPTPTVDQKP